MKHGNTAIVTLLTILVLIVGGIWYARQRLWQSQPAGAIPVTQKEASPLDLRPAVIAKLQGLVAQGSEGLYKLRIDSLRTETGPGAITLIGVGLYPDSVAIRNLDAAQKLPDDIFEIELKSLRISGIGLDDILHHRSLDIEAITCDAPLITGHHYLQPYNAQKRAAAKSQTMFSRLKERLDRLAIDSVAVVHATFTDAGNGRPAVYKNVSLLLRDVLIDSAAERDATRFFFAKKLLLQADNVNVPLGNSQYDLGIGSFSVAGDAKQAEIRNLSLRPHGGRAAFLRRQKEQIEVYDIALPLLRLRGADWWAALHGESLLADEAEINGAVIGVYLDQRMPASPTIKRDNFPQQMLADAGLHVSLKRVMLRGATLNYDELTRRSGVESRLTFNDINAKAEGITNISAEVKAHLAARVRGSCRLMNAGLMTGDFLLELPRARKGAFKATLSMGPMGKDAVNPFSEGMGLVRFTSGELQSASAHMEGNNDNVHGALSARYMNLHIEPLKPKEDTEGRLKGKRVTGTIANGLFVKDNNPGKHGKMREPEFSLDRTKEGNFFNFVWMGLKMGLLKTLGVPLKLGGM